MTQPTLAVNADRIELDAAKNEQDDGTGSKVFAGACWELQWRARSPAAQGEGDLQRLGSVKKPMGKGSSVTSLVLVCSGLASHVLHHVQIAFKLEIGIDPNPSII